MATFQGYIREYPGVVIDEFSAHTYKDGRAFFLSHAHSDHMRGLKDKFSEFLSLSGSKLYTTEITKSILSSVPDISPVLKHIECIVVNCEVKIKLSNGLEVLVTALQTGHCPGAVMFLFEGSNGNVLYTGDFRLSVEDLGETKIFREGGSDDLIEIDALYLDTTFCHPAAERFIPREVSRDILLEKVSQWLDQHKDNKICLNFPCLGYEHAILYLNNNLGIRLNVSRTHLLRQYESISLLKDAITTEASRIHVVSSFAKEEIKSHILSIKLSAQWFVRRGLFRKEYQYFEKFNFWRVQHSNHCSYSELREFVKRLNPRRMIPIVIPVMSSSTQEAVGRLKHLLKPILPVVETSSCEVDVILDRGKKMNSLKRVRSKVLEVESESSWSPLPKRERSTKDGEVPTSVVESDACEDSD